MAARYDTSRDNEAIAYTTSAAGGYYPVRSERENLIDAVKRQQSTVYIRTADHWLPLAYAQLVGFAYLAFGFYCLTVDNAMEVYDVILPDTTDARSVKCLRFIFGIRNFIFMGFFTILIAAFRSRLSLGIYILGVGIITLFDAWLTEATWFPLWFAGAGMLAAAFVLTGSADQTMLDEKQMCNPNE
ncbi:hypothetical protein QBC35DRAFT_230200 [Podospora australis]|uniref:Uncharacterized protein n=1 Tax=Podospora australis TaxID=1536484 RepID=A0AAN7AJ59_9PEZI|nr:hypothetical protein QBC35DRAFT_230200 [Podospora australis]